MPERRAKPGLQLDLRQLQARWNDLHQGDTEAWPQDEHAQQAWLMFHRGQFEAAVSLGMAAGPSGLNAINKAQSILALHLHTDARAQMALLQAVADRSGSQLLILGSASDALARAHFWRGFALTHCCRRMNVVKALTLGLSLQARTHLELAVALSPRHADAHSVLAGFHADIIDQVGPLIAQISYGANSTAALKLIDQAQALNARSLAGLLEQARALRMLQGQAAEARVRALHEQVARMQALDAAEALCIDAARTELRA